MLWNWITKVGNIAKQSTKFAAHLIGNTVRGAQTTVRQLGQVGNFIDKVINKTRDIPVLGQIGQEVEKSGIYTDAKNYIHKAEFLLNNPLTEQALGLVDRYSGEYNNQGEIRGIFDLAKDIKANI